MPALAVGQVTCVAPPSGLIGWWRAEGNGNDSAGTNGAYALPNVVFTNGMVGQTFSFLPDNYGYGVYTGVRIADQPYYALTNSLSIEGWIRQRGNGVVFYRGDNRSGYDPYSIAMGNNNAIGFGITDANNNSASVTTVLPYNVWTHIAGTLDGASGQLSLYTNGSLAAQITTSIRPIGSLIPQDSPGIGIGNVNDGSNNFPFHGEIDEISLYNRALSATEIQAIYQAGSQGKCILPSGTTTCFSLPAGLVSWWRAEENAVDFIGGANGTPYGGVTFATGRVGQCFAFNGVNGAINVPDTPALALTNSLTIECWLLVTNAPSAPAMVLFRGDNRSGLDPYYLVVMPVTGTSATLNFVVINQANVSANVSSAMPMGGWTHVAATLDDATGLMTLYTNGVVAAQLTTTVRPLGPLDAGYQPGIGIGNAQSQPGQFNYPFRGCIDELSVYSRALSATEVQGIYNAGSNGKCTTPMITSQPQSQIGYWEESVVFNVTAVGDSPLSTSG